MNPKCYLVFIFYFLLNVFKQTLIKSRNRTYDLVDLSHNLSVRLMYSQLQKRKYLLVQKISNHPAVFHKKYNDSMQKKLNYFYEFIKNNEDRKYAYRIN